MESLELRQATEGAHSSMTCLGKSSAHSVGGTVCAQKDTAYRVLCWLHTRSWVGTHPDPVFLSGQARLHRHPKLSAMPIPSPLENISCAPELTAGIAHAMSAPSDTPGESRFAAANSTPQQVLSSNTVGLVALSDFRKRRAELLDQQDRDSASSDGLQTPDAAPTPPSRSQTGTPKPVLGASTSLESSAGSPKKKKKAAKKGGPAKLSFGGDNDDDINDAPVIAKKFKKEAKSSISNGDEGAGDSNGNDAGAPATSYKLKANTAVAVVPRSMTKSALLREAAERETLRKEFLARQEAVKATEIAVPFVFYDGADLPGGVVRVKKGDFIWIFLDKSRKVGAQLGVGEKVNATKVWARVGVDDLVMVRGGVIIPHVSHTTSDTERAIITTACLYVADSVAYSITTSSTSL